MCCRRRSANGGATLIATGSEVAVAAEAQRLLAADGIAAALVSMPSGSCSTARPATYRAQVLGSAVRVAVEAAAPFGWERYIGVDGGFVGMRGFGASAPAEALFEHFEITAQAVADAVKTRL